MARRLIENVTSHYIGAAGKLNPKNRRRKIVVYVEGYEDVMFWRTLLSEVETEGLRFEVMLPSRTSLQKGKKCAIMNTLGAGAGDNMIVCVDADYDYLLQGATNISDVICHNPYIFHTYTYAIENFQCYAPSLHNVCVMATLNDRMIFDFERFLSEWSRVVFPIFVWSIWCYKHGQSTRFSMVDLCRVIAVTKPNIQRPDLIIADIASKVNSKIAWLQRNFPSAKGVYQKLRDELQTLGVTPEKTYLFVRGHDLFEKVVTPLLTEVCTVLRREREREIRKYANHATQCMNELSGYEHAAGAPEEMLRKHTDYQRAPLYKRIQDDIREFLAHIDEHRPNEPKLQTYDHSANFKK